MRNIKLYIASSLNGKIADKDGSVDWLDKIPNPDKNDYGYAEFYSSVDATIMGNSTYKQIIDWGIDFPYKDKTNYVLTRNKYCKKADFVEFITENHIEFIRQLKLQAGKDIWLIGGGKVNSMLLDAGLIDEIHLFIMPVVLPGGIDLFESNHNLQLFKTIETKHYSSGVIKCLYSL